MITFPLHLTATKYPGYYWDIVLKKLYSIKVDGVLNELKKRKVTKFNTILVLKGYKYYYSVSVKGKRKVLTSEYLKKLKYKDSIIPYKR